MNEYTQMFFAKGDNLNYFYKGRQLVFYRKEVAALVLETFQKLRLVLRKEFIPKGCSPQSEGRYIY